MSSSVSSVANCVEHISFGKGNQLCDLIDLQFITYIIVKYYVVVLVPYIVSLLLT